MSGFEKFTEKLRSKEKFCSLLTAKNISDEVYEHILGVWHRFKVKTVIEYHDLYLKRDVSFLVDVFQKFRNSSLKNCGLCPSHYLSASDFS